VLCTKDAQNCKHTWAVFKVNQGLSVVGLCLGLGFCVYILTRASLFAIWLVFCFFVHFDYRKFLSWNDQSCVINSTFLLAHWLNATSYTVCFPQFLCISNFIHPSISSCHRSSVESSTHSIHSNVPSAVVVCCLDNCRNSVTRPFSDVVDSFDHLGGLPLGLQPSTIPSQCDFRFDLVFSFSFASYF